MRAHARAIFTRRKGKRRLNHLSPFTFPFHFSLSLSLLDSQFTTIIAARRAYSVINVQRATVRACSQCRRFYYVMGTTFRLSGVALSSFRMCHVAFGNRCALVYTAPLNKRATDASALPIANTTLVYAGDPLCRLRGFKLLNDSYSISSGSGSSHR